MKNFVIAVNVRVDENETHDFWRRLFYDEAASLQAAKAICFDYLTNNTLWRVYKPTNNPVYMSIETPAGKTAFFQQIN